MKVPAHMSPRQVRMLQFTRRLCFVIGGHPPKDRWIARHLYSVEVRLFLSLSLAQPHKHNRLLFFAPLKRLIVVRVSQ